MKPSVAESPWTADRNTIFAREGHCLRFASVSQSLRDCTACRTIAWCNYYDRAGVREIDRLALGRWEDDGGAM